MGACIIHLNEENNVVCVCVVPWVRKVHTVSVVVYSTDLLRGPVYHNLCLACRVCYLVWFINYTSKYRNFPVVILFHWLFVSRDQPHLAPMSFGRPAAHQRPHEAMLGRLKVTIAQVHYSILPSPSLPISPSLYLTSSLRLSLLFLPLPLSPFPHTLHVAHSVVCKSTTNQLSRN